MKNYLKIMALAFVLVSATLFVLNTNAQNSQASVEIIAGDALYNVSGSIDLSGRAASLTAYDKDTVNATFESNSFVVNDLVGTSNMAFTIKSADLTTAGGEVISSGNIFIKLTTPLSITGDATCSSTVTTTLTSTYVSLDTARTYLQKTSDGELCKAALAPTIGIDIPAGQAVGLYTATLTIDHVGFTYNGSLTY